ncbi:hypothetical protein [Thermodesulfobacterium hydrogeniphilum]|uniref:hypothetical protein n=1 Tax=Thermodesulfobacterium hydrogeniphilum TaxID=161156 RepID=UPI000ADE9195|nr:hypothetical protein [Thermodesulfobacterium hydrogeniphilum]
MEEMDKIVSLKDWIDSFWNFQEEDLKYFKGLITKKNPFDPEEILVNIKERINARKVFYQIYKYLPRKDLPLNELEWAEQKLAEILVREELITDLINKTLEVLTFLIDQDQDKSLNISEIFPNSFILH